MNNKKILLSAIMLAMITTSCGTTKEKTQYIDFIETTTAVSETTTEFTTMLTTTTEVSTEVSTTSEITTVTEQETAVETVEIKVEEPIYAEPVSETEPIVVQPVEEFLVYKPSTHYAHKNTCRWNSGDAYRCDNFSELETRICTECNPEVGEYIEYVVPEPEVPSSDGLTYIKHFSRGTYYTAWSGACGGSGRTLIDCSYGNGEVKGSIASSYLYSNYGYNYNGSRTKVYLEVSGYPSMSGWYFVDDCDAGNWNVIDFYYDSGWNCPFQSQGVVEVDCYM